MLDILSKEALGGISIVIGASSYLPYLWLILKKRIRPHAFSFLIWAVAGGTVFAAQLFSGGGAGSWINAMFAVLTGLTFFIAWLYHGERDIRPMDWASLAVAFAGIALWTITSNPLWSVFIMTAIDGVGYIPTYRKTYKNPYEESASLYIFGTLSFMFSLLALGEYNLTTITYPVIVILFNSGVIGIVFVRRWQLRH